MVFRGAAFSIRWIGLKAVNNSQEPNYGGLVCLHDVLQSVLGTSIDRGRKRSTLLSWRLRADMPLSVTENCHCRGRHEVSGHKNNKPAGVCLGYSPLCSNRHDFDSNNISKQFLNLADRKNTNHLDKCVSSASWRVAIRIYPV